MKHEKLLAQLIARPPANIESLTGRATPDFAGNWLNELKSSMDLTTTGSKVSGIYTSVVSSTGNTISGPIIGYVAGDVIAFSVLWPTATASITTWVGQIVTDNNGTEQLDTLWHLIVNVADAQDPNSTWTTIHAGADQFHR